MENRLKPAHLADLVLGLGDLELEENEESLRATAIATLTYRPEDGSPPVVSRRFRFTAPLGLIEAEEIAWYLERYVRWPSGLFDDRAKRVEATLPVWGGALFNAIAVESVWLALSAWKRAGGVTGRRFTVEIDPDPLDGSTEARRKTTAEAASMILALPWELLHDGEDYLFQGQQRARVRRRMPNRYPREPLFTKAPIRVLLVSPRPEDERAAFIDHRVTAKPLLEALSGLGDLARFVSLSPATFPTLATELERARSSGKPYHVIHFDGHGVYDSEHGHGALCFEHPEDTSRLDGRRSVTVSAEEIAAVLRDHRVPLVFLEACQSAKTDADPTASVAGRLLQEGVASVVAMSHSVLVETTGRFVKVFYRDLAAGRRVGEAMLAGQRELAADTYRGKSFLGGLHLQDWFVPVLFQEDADPSLVEEVPDRQAEIAISKRRHSEFGKLPPEPTHFFVGRSRDLLRAERLLTRERYAVFRGEGGEGKTALATELARWLVATDRVDRASFVSLEREVDARTVLWALGGQLVSRFGSEAGQDEDRAIDIVEHALAEKRTILMIDNVESILPRPGAPSSASTGDESEVLKGILTLLERLGRVGETRLLFTSREQLPKPFENNHLPVGRLDRNDAIALVGRVLSDVNLRPPSSDAGDSIKEIEALVDAVQCHARSLVLLAREIAHRGVRGTTEDLQKLMAALEKQHPGDRERSLFASVELSLRRLSEETRRNIRPLGAFQGGGLLGTIANVLGIDTGEVVTLSSQLVQVGLGELVPPGYLRLDPALSPLLLGGMDAEERKANRKAWARAMGGEIQSLYELRRMHTQTVATFVLLDLPNLLSALEDLSTWTESDLFMSYATPLETLIAAVGRPAALARATKLREAASSGLALWSHARYLAQSAALERLLELGRSTEAVAAARALLQNAEAGGYEAFEGAAFGLATCYEKLGQALFAARDLSGALRAFETANERFEELAAEGSPGAARMVSAVLSRTSTCLTELGRLDDAAQNHEHLIELAKAQGDRRNIAVARMGLGTVRLYQQKIPEALSLFHEAREVFEVIGEPISVASCWHQIGMAHEDADDCEAAEDAYQAAIGIRVREGDRSGEAATLNQLGTLYRRMARHEESARFLLKAGEIYARLSDLARERTVRQNLVGELLAVGRNDDARRELGRVMECEETLGHSAEPWTTYTLQEQLERAAGHSLAAAAAREKAIQAYCAYRKAGGKSLSLSGQFCDLEAHALANGEVDALTARFSVELQRPNVPPWAGLLFPALKAILAGSRDPKLAADPKLDFDDAVELRLLLESLVE